MDENRKKYNDVLGRIKRAEKYFERPDIISREKDLYLPECNSLMSEANRLLALIGSVTRREVLEGFSEKEAAVACSIQF